MAETAADLIAEARRLVDTDAPTLLETAEAFALLSALAEALEAAIAREAQMRDGLETIEGGHPCDESHREDAREVLARTRPERRA